MLATWQILSPATPLLAVIGWGVSFLLDPSHKKRQAIAEMEADQIDTYAEQMRQAAKSEEVYQEILQAAKLQARQFAQGLHGQHSNGTSSASSGTVFDRESSKRTMKIPELATIKPSRNGHGEDPNA